MKKIFLAVLCLLLTFPALAGGQSIIDEASLLTPTQVSRLEEQAAEIEENYDIDVVILTVPSTDGRDARAYADDYFDYNGYGPDGILLLLVMDTREWVISTSGTVMDTMSSYDCDNLFNSAAPYISDGDYIGGFERYLDQLPMYVYPGHPNAVPNEMSELGKIAIALLIGFVIGGIVIFIMIRSMRSARPKGSAADYVDHNSFHMRTQRDFYLYSHTTRTKIESNSSGSHRGSSGRSHGGSRGRF